MSKSWQNRSGYSDFTAYNAIKNVTAEEQKVDRAAHLVVTTIKNILELAGFEPVGRIQIKHKKSGRVFK